MSPDPGPSLAKAGTTFTSWGVPLIAGAGGFLTGDIFDTYGFIKSWFSEDLEGQIPFSARLDYAAGAAAGLWAVGAAIALGILYGATPRGRWVTMVLKSIGFYAGGVAGRLVLAFVAPGRVGPSLGIAFPAAVR